MADKNLDGFPVDSTGKGMAGDPTASNGGTMGLNFDTSSPPEEPGFRSSTYGWGKFSPTSETQTISVEQVSGDPFGMGLGAPNKGFAGGPGGKSVHNDAKAGPA